MAEQKLYNLFLSAERKQRLETLARAAHRRKSEQIRFWIDKEYSEYCKEIQKAGDSENQVKS